MSERNQLRQMGNTLTYIRGGHYFNGRNGWRVIPMRLPFKQRFNELEHAYTFRTPGCVQRRAVLRVRCNGLLDRALLTKGNRSG